MRERWLGEDGESLAAEVFSRLKAGHTVGNLGLGEVDGRVDLRGLAVQLPRREYRQEVNFASENTWLVSKLAGKTVLEGVSLSGLDLTAAFLDQVVMRDCLIENCLLERVHWHQLGFVRCEIRNTSMKSASLRDASIGSWREGKGNSFRSVDFTDADLREAGWVTASFSDCTFSGAYLDGVKFKLCGLIRCRFSGVLRETEFDGRIFARDEGTEPNIVEDVDMSAAVLRNVQFRGFNLDAVKLPNDPGLRVIRDYPCVLREALELLASREDEDSVLLSRWINDRLRGLRGGPLGLANREDFIRYGGVIFADLAEAIFTEAESICARL